MLHVHVQCYIIHYYFKAEFLIGAWSLDTPVDRLSGKIYNTFLDVVYVSSRVPSVDSHTLTSWNLRFGIRTIEKKLGRTSAKFHMSLDAYKYL